MLDKVAQTGSGAVMFMSPEQLQVTGKEETRAMRKALAKCFEMHSDTE